MGRSHQNTYGRGMLVILRHGESRLNEEGCFSGWADCPLTPKGAREAHDAGRELRVAGISFDACFTSVLSRAVETMSIILGELGLEDIPVTRTWRLNERHYGILEGCSRNEAARLYGADQVEAWRNAPDATPPPLALDDMRHPRHKAIYSDVPSELLPASECLRMAFRRVADFFEEEIRPLVESGSRILVVSHGNPIRALVAHLEGLPDGEVPGIGIRNAAIVAYVPEPSGGFRCMSVPEIACRRKA